MDPTARVVYCKPIPGMVEAPRSNVPRQVKSLTGLEVPDANITVNDVTFRQR